MKRLIDAIKVDDAVQVEKLLSTGIDPNGCEDYAKITPLHFAAQCNALQSAEALLRAGANLESQTIDGMTPIEIANMHHHKDMVALLLEERWVNPTCFLSSVS